MGKCVCVCVWICMRESKPPVQIWNCHQLYSTDLFRYKTSRTIVKWIVCKRCARVLSLKWKETKKEIQAVPRNGEAISRKSLKDRKLLNKMSSFFFLFSFIWISSSIYWLSLYSLFHTGSIELFFSRRFNVSTFPSSSPSSFPCLLFTSSPVRVFLFNLAFSCRHQFLNVCVYIWNSYYFVKININPFV